MSAATLPTREAHSGLVIDRVHRRASVNGADLYLSEVEFALLAALVAEPGRAFTPVELVAELFGGEASGLGTEMIERRAWRIARKLELRGMAGRLRCRPGVGLRLEIAEAAVEDGGSR